MDGVKAAAKLADSHGDAVTEVRSEVRKTPFYPTGERLAAAMHGKRSPREADHNHDQYDRYFFKNSPRLHSLRRGRKEGCQHEQESKASDIENALHSPDRELGGKGEILTLCDEVGADEFSGAA